MEIFIVSAVAFGAAILTFFSGFGLGTLLTPVFLLFFPVEVAIALTGVVHFFNNLFKFFLVGKYADKTVLLRFGLPAVLAAFLGAGLLLNLTDLEPLFSYSFLEKEFSIYPIKFLVAILLIFFACFEFVPYLAKLEFGKEKMPIGGFLSGFFGGLSGNQGALRSAFLIRSGLSKEALVGTSVVISCLVDFTRLSLYSTQFLETGLQNNLTLVLCAAFSGILGSYLGNKLLKKITLSFLKVSTAALLISLGLALGAGWL